MTTDGATASLTEIEVRRPPSHRKSRMRRLPHPFVFVIGSFVLLALTANIGPWIHGIGAYQSVCPGTCQDDPLQGAWFLGLTPYSILHHQDPFLTNFINYPTGVN